MIDTSKIIHAPVGGGRYTVTAPIVKEDYGLYIKIEGLELPSTYEVDFSNSEHSGTSATMIGNSDGVLIPHQFIDTGKDIFAFLYHVGVDYGRTVYKFRIPNKLRPDRTDEQPTPEEQSTIDQAIAALNDAVAQTAQDVIDADASAQSASADADRAEEARTDAQNYATQAEASATNASNSASSASASATASANSASQAEQIKTDVQGLVSDAQGYAQSASQSATASANSASQASASATSASQSASSASGYATSAQTSAQTASTKASEASTSAQTASAKASESAQSASSALGYKNDALQAKTSAQTAQGLAESARDLAQGYAFDAQGYANDAQASAESVSASASQIAKNSADILKAFPTDTASGAIASFSDGADNIPLKSLIVNIDPVQSGTGDPSPDNVRPISGWTGMQLSVNGTVIPISWSSEAGTVYGGQLNVLSGVLTVDKAIVDLGTLNWTYESTLPRFYTKELANDIRLLASNDNVVDGVSSMYKVVSFNNLYVTGKQNGTMAESTTKAISVINTDYTDATSFKTAMRGQMFVYPLATPLTYQLSAQEIKSLLGTNNIFADTGNTSVEYCADTRLYIEKLTQPTEDDMVANSAIASGQFFMIGNTLYKALASIASGATITVGTNAQRVSLADALNLINT